MWSAQKKFAGFAPAANSFFRRDELGESPTCSFSRGLVQLVPPVCQFKDHIAKFQIGIQSAGKTAGQHQL